MTNAIYFLFICTVLLPLQINAQLSSLGPHYPIDTLEKRISNNKEDTSKVRNLILLSREYSGKNTDTAYKIAESALQLATQLKWNKGIGTAHIVKAWCLYVQGNYNKAMASNFIAKKIGEDYNEPQVVLYALSNLGQVHYSQGDLNQALTDNTNALKIAQQTSDEWNIARNVGIIGNIYQDMKEYDSAFIHFHQAYHLSKKIGNSNGSGVWLRYIGELYLHLNQYDSALLFLNKASKIFDSLGNKWSYAESILNIGKIHTLKRNYKLSYQFIIEALQLSSQVGAADARKNVYLELSNLYQNSTISLPDIISERQLNDAQRKTLALEYFKKHIALKDSLDNIAIQKKSLVLEYEHKMASEKLEMEKKDAITKQQIQTQRIIRNAFILGSILLILLIAVIINRNKLKRKVELETIRNKLSRDLHDDIGSTISSINILSSRVQQNKEGSSDEKAKASLEKIHERSQRLLRNMSDIIWNINPNNDSLEELMSRMREYSTTILEAKNIDYEFHFPNETVNAKLTMEVKNNIYLVFKECVNNLVKYSGCSKAILTLRLNNRSIYVSVEDNGCGFAMDSLKHKGGLSNMQYRVNEMKGELIIKSQLNLGTCIEFTLPIHHT